MLKVRCAVHRCSFFGFSFLLQVVDCDSFVPFTNADLIPRPTMFTRGFSADEVYDPRVKYVSTNSDAQAYARMLDALHPLLRVNKDAAQAVRAIVTRFNVPVAERPSMEEFLMALDLLAAMIVV